MSLSSHQSSRMKSDTYLTPPEIMELLGEFSLDPCCPPDMPWSTASVMVSLPQDGLALDWSHFKRVWLNPPFGREAVKWLRKLKEHGNGIALIPARTETKMFYECVWGHADAVCFIKGRPHFFDENGKHYPFNCGAPLCLIAYGYKNAERLEMSGLGHVVSAK